MNGYIKKVLISLIKGLRKEEGNQYYSSHYIDDDGIETLIQFIKNLPEDDEEE